MQYKHARQCAFCEFLGKLTDEHVWPAWLAKSGGLPLTLHARNHYHRVVSPIHGFDNRGFDVTGVWRTRRAGDPGSEKLWIACGSCNNGWMSTLQDAAKPLITSLIHGDWPEMSEANSEMIAKWCVMTTMVQEFKTPALVAIPMGERIKLRKGEALSSKFIVWIGHCVPELPNRRAAQRALYLHDAPVSQITGPNMQITTLHVGKLLAHVVYCPLDMEIAGLVHSYHYDMFPIHSVFKGFHSSQPPMHKEQFLEVHHKQIIDFLNMHLGINLPYPGRVERLLPLVQE